MKILIVAFSMFKRSLSKKSTILVYILTPIIALIIPIIFSEDINNNESFALVDNDQTILSEEIICNLKNYDDISVKVLEKDIAESLLAENRVIAIIYIPKNYYSSLINGSIEPIQISCLKDNKEVNLIKTRLNILLKELILSINKNENHIKSIKVINKINESISLDNQMIGFIIVLFILIFTNSLSTIIKDRNNNVYTRVLLTDTSNEEYILGQLLWNFFLCFIEISIIILLVNIFNIHLGITLIEFWFILLCIGVMAMSIGIFIISFCNNENQISVISTLIVFPSSMLSGCLWPIEIMGDKYQKLSYVFPQRYIFILLDELSSNKSIYAIIITSTLIITISILIMIIGIFRVSNDIKEII